MIHRQHIDIMCRIALRPTCVSLKKGGIIFMCCRLVEMREKQVVCIKDGTILGFVGDVEVDTCSGKLVSIVIFGRKRCFGLFGRENDCRVPWESIEVIGEDSILVNFDGLGQGGRKKSGFFSSFFGS